MNVIINFPGSTRLKRAADDILLRGTFPGDCTEGKFARNKNLSQRDVEISTRDACVPWQTS